MGFDINEFKSKVFSEGGMLKGNRFLVRIPPPNFYYNSTAIGADGGIVVSSQSNAGDASKTSSIIEYFAESCNLPGITLQTTDIRRQGVGNLEKTPWGASFTDLDMVFRVDQKSQIWSFFKSWVERIYSFDISSGVNLHELEYKDDFTTTVSVFVYAENFPDQPVLTVDFQDAFPLSMPDIPLNWGSSDFIRMPIRFNYRSWNVRENPNLNVTIPRSEPRVDREVNPSDLYVGPSENAIQSDVRGSLNQYSNIYLRF